MSNLPQLWIKLKRLSGMIWPVVRDVAVALDTASPEEKRLAWKYLGRAMVLIIVWGVSLMSVAALVYRIMSTPTTHTELMDLIVRLWPYILTMLAPLGHYYFGSSRNKGDEGDNEDGDSTLS
jgi:hypothetical protein